MITVIGEALINLVLVSGDNTLRALPGGSALVVATRAASLGYPTALMARLSGDHFGRSLRRHAADHGVDISAAPEADEPTMIAVSGPGASGASLDRLMLDSLYFHGTASWQWSAEELRSIPPETTVLYVGSLAGCVSPGSGRILRAAARQRSRGTTICVDLNVCPEVVGSPGRGRLLIDRLIRSADVVRASIEGIGWLHPGRAPQAVAYQWLGLGPKLAVITCGGDGIMAVHSSGTVVHRPAPGVGNQADADNAFTAGLLGGLHGDPAADLENLSPSGITALIDSAALPVPPPLATSGRLSLINSGQLFLTVHSRLRI